MTTRDFQTRSPMRIFLSYFRPHRGLFLLDMTCAFFISLVDLAFPLISRTAMYHWLPDKRYSVFFTVMAIVLIAFVIRSILFFVVCYWGHTFGIRVEADIRRDLFAHMQELGFDFYDKNRDYRRGSLFTDRALYVPEVLFSRGGDVRRADVLVIAEPVRAFALENHRSERECDKALADRIETIFRVAAANGAETLIMGAFGCGRNGYPVEQVIELIQNWIAEHPGAVPNVVFAVPRMHADAFREAFGAPEPERPAPVVAAEDENDREGDDEDWRNVELPEGVTLR